MLSYNLYASLIVKFYTIVKKIKSENGIISKIIQNILFKIIVSKQFKVNHYGHKAQ